MTRVRVMEIRPIEGDVIYDIEFSSKVPIWYLKWLFPLVYVTQWSLVFGEWVGRDRTPTKLKTKYATLQEALEDAKKIKQSLNPIYHTIK